MIEELTGMMVRSGASWVLWLLFGLSIASVAVALERAWLFWTARTDSEAQVRALRRALRTGGFREARRTVRKWRGPSAAVVMAGLESAEMGSSASEESMAAALGLERARLSKGLLLLGTVGNNAPFVGLLGTVIGVVGAFDQLGQTGGGGALAPERVMGTIAEALVATAVGLVVAIPAVAAFNYLQGRVNGMLDDAQTLGHVLLSWLQGKQPEQELAETEREDSQVHPFDAAAKLAGAE